MATPHDLLDTEVLKPNTMIVDLSTPLYRRPVEEQTPGVDSGAGLGAE